MSALRDEIRAILREEIAALCAEAVRPVVEQVRISGSAELMGFVRDLLARAADPAVAADIAEGRLRFELAGASVAPVPAAPRVEASAPRAVVEPVLAKALVTEKDIAVLAPGRSTLRLGPNTRLTPLAKDEVRRRGLRIERQAS